MSRRSPSQMVLPVALAVGMLEDDGRALFLFQNQMPVRGVKAVGGTMAPGATASSARLFELPCVLVMPGENPVQRLTESFLMQTGIDAQVHETMRQASINVGTRKRRQIIPVLVFRLTSKRMSAKIAIVGPPGRRCPDGSQEPSRGAGWNGFVWMSIRQAVGEKFTRRGQWFLQPSEPERKSPPARPAHRR
jgi:hypothetical protein